MIGPLSYFRLYSIGDSPVMRLKIFLNAFKSLYPVSYIINGRSLWFISMAFFADSILTLCRYSKGVLWVAVLKWK